MTNEGNGLGGSNSGAPGPRRTEELTRSGEVVAQVRGVRGQRQIPATCSSVSDGNVAASLGHQRLPSSSKRGAGGRRCS